MLSIAWGFEFLGYQSQELFKDEPGFSRPPLPRKVDLDRNVSL
jgi:hypothetical protein